FLLFTLYFLLSAGRSSSLGWRNGSREGLRSPCRKTCGFESRPEHRDRFTTPRHMRIVVIGCGLGGLSTAIRLRALGHDVTVIDKQDQPGGIAQVYRQDGF